MYMIIIISSLMCLFSLALFISLVMGDNTVDDFIIKIKQKRVEKEIEKELSKEDTKTKSSNYIFIDKELLFNVLHNGFGFSSYNYTEGHIHWIGRTYKKEWTQTVIEGRVKTVSVISCDIIIPPGFRKGIIRPKNNTENFDIIYETLKDIVCRVDNVSIKSKLQHNFNDFLKVINRLMTETPTLIGTEDFQMAIEKVLDKYYNIHKKIVSDYEKLQKAKKEKEEELRRLEEERKEKQRKLQIELEKTKLNAFVNKWDKEFRIDLEE